MQGENASESHVSLTETPEAHLCFGRDEPTLKLQMNGDKCVFRSWTASKLWGVSTWVPSLFCIVFLQTTITNQKTKITTNIKQTNQ